MAVNVVEVPLQMVKFPVILIVGNWFTWIAKLSIFSHPLPSVPITVYVVFVVGLTKMESKVFPLFHKYELAPEILRVVDWPIQTLVFPVLINVGNGFTFNWAGFEVVVFVGSASSVTSQV